MGLAGGGKRRMRLVAATKPLLLNVCIALLRLSYWDFVRNGKQITYYSSHFICCLLNFEFCFLVPVGSLSRIHIVSSC